ncbi:MAG TPA: M48 family metallopeptidase [Bacteroidia bacterium]|nr:M48 family metallopeptidase [Bacteroidia bacterium]
MIYILVTIVLLHFLVDQILSFKNIQSWKKPIPSVLDSLYNVEQYERARKYHNEKYSFSVFASGFRLILMLGLLLSGSFAIILTWAESMIADPVWSILLFFAVLYFLFDLLNMPFDLYNIFVIENRYGFNQTTLSLYFIDKFKSYIIGGLMAGSLLAIVVILFMHYGKDFWIYAWVSFSVFLFLINSFYTTLILPLFNKLTPLEEGDLRSQVEQYCRKEKFKLKNLYVMDGSKRSNKANAFFSGFGPSKTIVLFDTLIKNHSVDEIVAVLAHEVGHYRKKHTKKFFIISLLNVGLILYLLSYMLYSEALSIALGAIEIKFALGLIAFGILYTPVSFLTEIFSNLFSRKNEFEADAFACETSDGKALAAALKKLSSDHLSNLNPHPAYVYVNYSHPPLLQRLNAIANRLKISIQEL